MKSMYFKISPFTALITQPKVLLCFSYHLITANVIVALTLSPHSPMLAENSRPTNCARCEKSFCEENENLRRISVLSWLILKTFFSSHILYTRHWELCSVNLYRRIESTLNGDISHSRGSSSVWNWEAFHLLLSLVVCSTLIARYNTEIPRDKFLVCNQIALIF